jgi:hypothetical protein
VNKKLIAAQVDKLIDVVDKQDELPEEVEGAINDLMAQIEDAGKVVWWKKPFLKDGEFSKTATFATVAYVITLFWYALSIFATGNPVSIGGFELPAIQPLDPTLTIAVLGIASGTYLTNNKLKSGSSHG